MLIGDILGSTTGICSTDVHVLHTECSQFLSETAGIPLLKALPASYQDFQKVKIRHQKRVDQVTEVFNEAFKDRSHKLRQRAIFAYSSTPVVAEDQNLFYVFPVNGYSYLYSKEVTNSSTDYRRVIDTLFESFDDTSKASEMITDLLKFTYSSQKLREGLEARAEVIFYGVPYYYAVRAANTPYQFISRT